MYGQIVRMLFQHAHNLPGNLMSEPEVKEPEVKEPEKCLHMDFSASVDMTRKKVDNYLSFEASVKVHCTSCGMLMGFVGLPATDAQLARPTVSRDSTKARLPMIPSGKFIFEEPVIPQQLLHSYRQTPNQASQISFAPPILTIPGIPSTDSEEIVYQAPVDEPQVAEQSIIEQPVDTNSTPSE